MDTASWSFRRETSRSISARHSRRSMATAVSKVFAQIDGRGIQADCTPISTSNLSGTWTGTSNYLNAPFQVSLVQNGAAISGQYSDRHDAGFVTGNANGLPNVTLNVNF